MTYIPDVRSKTIEPLYRNTAGEKAESKENGYYEGYLSEEDSQIVGVGFDTAVEDAENFFYNLEIYGDVESAFADAGLDVFKIQTDVLLDDKALEDYSDEELSELTAETKLVLSIGEAMLDWLEARRDEFVVGLIENYGEDEYERNVHKCKSGYKNLLLRRVED